MATSSFGLRFEVRFTAKGLLAYEDKDSNKSNLYVSFDSTNILP